MPEFVCNHACQLIFVIRKADQFSGHENITAGNVKSVGIREIDNEELKLESGCRQVFGKLRAYISDIRFQLGISHEAHVAGHVLVGELAEYHLLLGSKNVVDIGI